MEWYFSFARWEEKTNKNLWNLTLTLRRPVKGARRGTGDWFCITPCDSQKAAAGVLSSAAWKMKENRAGAKSHTEKNCFMPMFLFLFFFLSPRRPFLTILRMFQTLWCVSTWNQPSSNFEKSKKVSLYTFSSFYLYALTSMLNEPLYNSIFRNFFSTQMIKSCFSFSVQPNQTHTER